jgi:hypothetical protein
MTIRRSAPSARADIRAIARAGVMLAGVGVAPVHADPFELLRAVLMLDGRAAALAFRPIFLPRRHKR